MIVKLECFSGHCHIATDQLGLVQFGWSFVLNFKMFALVWKKMTMLKPTVLEKTNIAKLWTATKTDMLPHKKQCFQTTWHD